MAVVFAMVFTPSALSDSVWAVAAVQDNAGNGTGVLLLSALVPLVWMQNRRSVLAPLLLGALGWVAGFGLLG